MYYYFFGMSFIHCGLLYTKELELSRWSDKKSFLQNLGIIFIILTAAELGTDIKQR